MPDPTTEPRTDPTTEPTLSPIDTAPDEPTKPQERLRFRMAEAFGRIDIDAEIRNAPPRMRELAALALVELNPPDEPGPVDTDRELERATPEQREQIGLGFRLARAMREGQASK